jgi:hypothetical protein
MAKQSVIHPRSAAKIRGLPIPEQSPQTTAQSELVL